jgi:SulP family sulfate permease
VKKFIPSLQWIASYKRKNLSSDLSAGLTVGVMLIPQGMAYAMLAGLPPIYGLYASTIPIIIYSLFGTSRQLAVGPVAMVALLISSGVGHLAELQTPEFIGYAILLALMVGVLQFGMGVFRLGFLVNFLSHPVIAGFTSAAAIIIGFSQLKHLFGLDIPRGNVFETFFNIVQNFQDINLPTLGIGVGSILILIILKRMHKRIPAPLIVVVIGMLFVYMFSLDEVGVRIVKEIPNGLPGFAIPVIDGQVISVLLPIALTISFVGFMESIAVSKAVQKKHKDYELNPNQELIGLGLANIVGSFFKAFPVTGGFSRTAVNDQAGAKTGLAGIISALLIIITLLFFTQYFYYLPNAILAAIILVAVYGLIDFVEAKHLWKTDKQDFLVFMVTALATLILGIEVGVLTGVILCIGLLVYRASYPHIAELGQVSGTDSFRNVDRIEDVKVSDELLIVRLDAQLFYANIEYFKTRLGKLSKRKKNLKVIILHSGSIEEMDSSAVHALADIVKEYHNQNIKFIMTDVVGPVRDTLTKTKLYRLIGENNFFLSVKDAVESLSGSFKSDNNKDVILQSKY